MSVTCSRKLLDLPMFEYHRRPGLSSSALAYADDSLAKYHSYLNGEIKFESRALDLGSAVHLLIESPIAFQEKYVLKPNGLDKRTKSGKEAHAELQSNGRIVLDEDQWRVVHTLYDHYMNHEDDLIRMVIESEGVNEGSVFWTERDRLMKCRPDRLITPSALYCDMLHDRWPSLFPTPFGIQIVVDYKTTSKPIDPKNFYWTCINFKYFLKAAHYLAGTKADAFLFVVLETVPPYGVTRYFISPYQMNAASERRECLLDLIQEAEDTGIWMGICPDDEETLL